jgi:coenzyme F420-dependent glucose-6-phosphate dehydrogenase
VVTDVIANSLSLNESTGLGYQTRIHSEEERMQIGYKLSSEEHGPGDLVEYAARAESIGMRFALISDHFHPWIERQGQSPFVWATLGAIAHTTNSLKVGTAVTCPTIRIHPAIVAQAAATVAVMMPDRFFLGVGTGENLNEHVLGDKWPAVSTRLEMLEEAVALMRELWTGRRVNFKGTHYITENARLYTRPEDPIDVIVAASGAKASALAGKIGDGLVSVAPHEEVLQAFDDHGGSGKPRYAEVQVCWAETEAEARNVAYGWWPNVAVKGQLGQELPLPAHSSRRRRWSRRRTWRDPFHAVRIPKSISRVSRSLPMRASIISPCIRSDPTKRAFSISMRRRYFPACRASAGRLTRPPRKPGNEWG